jgi:hypothetical protein
MSYGEYLIVVERCDLVWRAFRNGLSPESHG